MIALGIDIGGTGVKAALRDGDGLISTATSGRYQRPETGTLREAINQVVEQLGNEHGSPAALGLCVPGLFADDRSSIQTAVNVPGLEGVRFDDIAGWALPGARWAVINDADAAALDIWHGSEQDGRLLAISIGTGVGASVIDDGTPLDLGDGGPGHIGMIDVSLDAAAPTGSDGGQGSLEAYVGHAALVDRFGDDPEARLKGLSDPCGEPFRSLVRAIRICHAIYRPQHVALLGGLGIRLGPVSGEIREAVNRGLTSIAREEWTLSTGSHDHHAASGAAILASHGVVKTVKEG